MTDVKERPILFSAPMVRAILEGRKTVTRRAVKKPAALDCLAAGFEPSFLTLPGNADLCPFGKPGDRLWVRETTGEDSRGSISTTTYSADGAPSDLEWRYSRLSCPSIHMPRKACRILLEITDVRVERLQDISDEQVIAEGCFFTDYGRKCGHSGTGWTDVGTCPAPESTHQQREGWMWDKTTSHEQCLGAPRWAFANLWNSTGGNWDSNPWVWTVSFKKVTP